ncbi:MULTISPECIES: DUF3021 family protein [Paenibacillus]|uniref:DUF3021 domain-containing protein n=1 Tax=Paenibacillus borealis TaxID=160799 RepID=A0ABX3H0H6_PAEBO|nr:DUF3021 family protein [Paenibacillus borealis]OMD39423.1 hypothetical protein BSK56_29605 [Paenibacillus borealis]
MRFSEFVKETIREFLMIFASVVIIITILRQIFAPDIAFDLKSIYILMAFSFLSALTGIILYAPHGISEKRMRVRIVVHFFTLEILLISLGSLIGAVSSVSGALTLAIEIAVVYAIVRLLSYENDKKEAGRINERLKAVKKGTYE